MTKNKRINMHADKNIQVYICMPVCTPACLRKRPVYVHLDLDSYTDLKLQINAFLIIIFHLRKGNCGRAAKTYSF